MSIVMKRAFKIEGNYTDKQKDILQTLIRAFRVSVADDIPEKNLLDGRKATFTDDKIVHFYTLASWDINTGSPRTRYTIFDIYDRSAQILLLRGAMVQMLISEGILQLKNQVDYSDAGLSIQMFNKTGLYQSWLGQLLHLYEQDKQKFKASIVASKPGAGMLGIGSEFGYRRGW